MMGGVAQLSRDTQTARPAGSVERTRQREIWVQIPAPPSKDMEHIDDRP